MSDKAWKAFERWVAAYLGGERSWKDLEDVSHEWLSVECKYRKSLPAWICDAMRQAAVNAPDGKLPLVVLCEKGQPRESALVMITLHDFRDWFGG